MTSRCLCKITIKSILYSLPLGWFSPLVFVVFVDLNRIQRRVVVVFSVLDIIDINISNVFYGVLPYGYIITLFILIAIVVGYASSIDKVDPLVCRRGSTPPIRSRSSCSSTERLYPCSR